MSITSNVEYKPFPDFTDRKKIIMKESSCLREMAFISGSFKFELRQFEFENELLL